MIIAKIGNLLDEEVEVLVNPANGIGIMGAGVAGALRNAGGRVVQYEAINCCDEQGSPIDAGKSYVTGSGRLSAKGVKFIYHAVTMALPGSLVKKNTVIKAMWSVLEKAKENGIKSIAFPGLGTGIGRLDVKEAAHAMVGVASLFNNNIDIHIVDRNSQFIDCVRNDLGI